MTKISGRRTSPASESLAQLQNDIALTKPQMTRGHKSVPSSHGNAPRKECQSDARQQDRETRDSRHSRPSRVLPWIETKLSKARSLKTP